MYLEMDFFSNKSNKREGNQFSLFIYFPIFVSFHQSLYCKHLVLGLFEFSSFFYKCKFFFHYLSMQHPKFLISPRLLTIFHVSLTNNFPAIFFEYSQSNQDVESIVNSSLNILFFISLYFYLPYITF